MERYFIFAAFFIGLAKSSGLNLPDFLLGGNFEFIDLTHDVDNNTIVWPGRERYHNIRQVASDNRGYWYAVNDFCTTEHGGTHFDAPYHFNEVGLTVGAFPLSNLITSLLVIDIRSYTNDNASFDLHKQHVEKELNDKLKGNHNKVTILFNFGWSKYYGEPLKYLGGTEADSLNFPGLDVDIPEYVFANFKNVVGVGLDTASIDPGSSKTFDTHKFLAKNNMYDIENVNFCEEIPTTGCVALVMPTKLAYGTGAPLRLVAICPKKG